MPLKSLSARLLVTSLAWSVFALLATGVVLASAFRSSVEKRFDDTLGVHLSNLIGQLAEAGDGRFLSTTLDLGEPRFLLPFSGWYWQVTDTATGETIQTSESLAGDVISIPEAIDSIPPGALYQSDAQGPFGEALRFVARRVSLDEGEWLLVAVGGAAATIEEDTARFATRLVLVLGLFAATLVAVTFVQWRIGLRPLKELGSELTAIQEGRSNHVRGRYPTEIQPVADALNTLIDANQATLERARQHVGNLAHALKTPLSVMMNDAGSLDGALARSVREQTQIMQRQIRHYLERAQMAAKERMIGTVTEVGPVLERLHRAMARLGERRGIAVRLVAPTTIRFAGEQQDFEEIVGNLVDNGLKWARSEVVIELSNEAAGGPARQFTVCIADDGPGLSDEARTEVLSRGKRLDQSKPGSGLGLSIVSELVALYGGALSLERSQLGGLLAVVHLPRA